MLGVTSFKELNPSFVAKTQGLGRSWLDSAFPCSRKDTRFACPGAEASLFAFEGSGTGPPMRMIERGKIRLALRLAGERKPFGGEEFVDSSRSECSLRSLISLRSSAYLSRRPHRNLRHEFFVCRQQPALRTSTFAG